jgi:23S rRNA (uridine2552-2'-O)-methyltransferase
VALEFAKRQLQPNCVFVVKIFQGEGFDEFVRETRKAFAKVQVRKPGASRRRSRKACLLATGRLAG